MRGRNRSKGPNPLTRSYESNGPDVKVRGTAQHIADKYVQLARDAQSSGDPVAAENYYQHAEHYYRIIAGAQEQFRQQFGGYGQRPFDDEEEGDEDGSPNGYPFQNGERPGAAANGEAGDIGSQPPPFECRSDERPQRSDRFAGERYDRGDRPERFGRDRNDRGNRPDRPPERAGNERYDRGERFDRGERNDRTERSDRTERNERGERSDRSDRGEQYNRFDRNDRADRGERRDDRGERFNRSEPGPRPEAPRERADEPRRPRREEAEEPAGLPAFLTTPVRAPMPVEPVEDAAEVPAPAEAADVPPVTAAEGEGNGRLRPRRRRRTRYEGPAEDGAPEGAAPAEDPTPAE